MSHRITVRQRTPVLELIWYDGGNAVEVAEFLQVNGKRPKVEFHSLGHVLSLDGYRIDIEREDGGIWVAADGRKLTKTNVKDCYEVVSER